MNSIGCNRRIVTKLLLLLTYAALSAAGAEIYTFALLPDDGNVSGIEGSTVGWGYSITNDSTTDWLVTTGLNADPFLYGTPDLIFDFPDLAPLSTVSVPFDLVSGTGLYQFTWETSPPLNFANFGTFTLNAEWWDGDPLNGGQFLSTALDSNASYLASVTQPPSTPEPATGYLAVMAGVMCLLSAGRGKFRPLSGSRLDHMRRRRSCLGSL